MTLRSEVERIVGFYGCCQKSTRPTWACLDDPSLTPDARYTADRQCDACQLHAALIAPFAPDIPPDDPAKPIPVAVVTETDYDDGPEIKALAPYHSPERAALDRLPDNIRALACAEYTLPDGWVPSIDLSLCALAPHPDVERPEFWFQASTHTKIPLVRVYFLWLDEDPWAADPIADGPKRFATAQEAIDAVVADFETRRAEAGR